MDYSYYDLNFGQGGALDHWNVCDGIREIIANALDERLLSGTQEPKIMQEESGVWRIRDFGRGLEAKHLKTEKNPEKEKVKGAIGMYGEGLKGALVVLHQSGIDVRVRSKHMEIVGFEYREKADYGFKCLHALVHQNPTLDDFEGTEFSFEGLDSSDIENAKKLFLHFRQEEVLERGRYGDILRVQEGGARIYIHGLQVGEEEDFHFSYNITDLLKSMEDSLNRDRKHVGRNAYRDRIMSMLLDSRDDGVREVLKDALKAWGEDGGRGELAWKKVQTHAVKLSSAEGHSVFVSPEQLEDGKHLIDQAKRDGHNIVVIPENLLGSLSGDVDHLNQPIRDLDQYIEEFNESFHYKFVELSDLTPKERKIFELKDLIFAQIGGCPKIVKSVCISETMRFEGMLQAAGVWQERERRIVIKRSQLSHLHSFAGTLLHEAAHAISGKSDVCRDFESELTRIIGILASRVVKAIRGEEEMANPTAEVLENAGIWKLLKKL